MSQQNKYWFKRKTFGFGWQPATLEGWMTILVYVGLMVMTIWESYRPDKPEMQIVKEELPTWAFLTLTLLLISYFKGEPVTKNK